MYIILNFMLALIFFCIVVNHLSVTNGSVNKGRNVDHLQCENQCSEQEPKIIDSFNVKNVIYHI